MPYVPAVIETGPNGMEKHYDLYSRMLKDRIVFLGSQVNDEVACSIAAQMLFLDHENPDEDIQFFISSPGGSIVSLYTILDCMNYVRPDVRTICMGQAASAAAVLLACGTQGKRSILPNARVLIHQPLGSASGQASDIERSYKEIQRMKDSLNGILAEQTKQPLTKIIELTDRDTIFTATEAVEFGLVDSIVKSKKKTLTTVLDQALDT